MEVMGKKVRVLLAKVGLDSHDRGVMFIAKALRDRGIEVIYSGLHQTPAQVVSAAIQEDVDIIGLSFLSASHLGLTEKVMTELKAQGGGDKIVIVGGVIPKADIPKLLDLGVAEIFPSGTPIDKIIDFIQSQSLT
jgi:methylmalonyl-CoA mutase C-terminal domain/subunit